MNVTVVIHRNRTARPLRSCRRLSSCVRLLLSRPSSVRVDAELHRARRRGRIRFRASP